MLNIIIEIVLIIFLFVFMLGIFSLLAYVTSFNANGENVTSGDTEYDFLPFLKLLLKIWIGCLVAIVILFIISFFV